MKPAQCDLCSLFESFVHLLLVADLTVSLKHFNCCYVYRTSRTDEQPMMAERIQYIGEFRLDETSVSAIRADGGPKLTWDFANPRLHHELLKFYGVSDVEDVLTAYFDNRLCARLHSD
jgi:hypothetical protein